MPRVTLRLDHTLARAVAAEAKRERRPVAEMAMHLVGEGLALYAARLGGHPPTGRARARRHRR
jgi:hypothetical protein